MGYRIAFAVVVVVVAARVLLPIAFAVAGAYLAIRAVVGC